MACRGIILNVNEPEVRGVAMAMQTVLDDLGKGLGLYVLAEMIAAWGRCAVAYYENIYMLAQQLCLRGRQPACQKQPCHCRTSTQVC